MKKESKIHPDRKFAKEMGYVRLIKIKESDNPYHPNNIKEGFVISGVMSAPPKIGEAFWVGINWRTSPIVKIIDDNTFETMNSIYKIERP